MSYEALLKDFVEPRSEHGRRIPYVLFGRPVRELVGGKPAESEMLFCLDMSGAHGQPDRISDYARKPGWKILKYALPSSSADASQFANTAARTLREWFELRQHIDMLSGAVDRRVKELEAEKKVMADKIAKYEKDGKNGR